MFQLKIKVISAIIRRIRVVNNFFMYYLAAQQPAVGHY